MAELHQIFLCMLPVALAQASSDNIGKHCIHVLPVVWMRLYFHTMGLMDQNQAYRCFK